MKKVLILIANNNNLYFPVQCENEEIKCYFEEIHKRNTISNRLLRNFFYKLHIKTSVFFNNEWLKKANNVDTIILFDTGNADIIIDYISDNFPDKRLIFWYWNPVERSVSPQSVNRQKAEIWSFDISDCKKYKFKYNNQFFFIENINKAKELNIKSPKVDCFFAGKSKDREKQLIDLSHELTNHGLSYFYYIITKDNKKSSDCNIKFQKKKMTYMTLLSYTLNCKAIIDFVFSRQNGLTLRPLEAIYLKKKLITNYKGIKKYDFYKKENIFIVGEDDFRKINDFINSPYNIEDYEKYIKKYSVYGWLNKFEI